MFGSLRHAVSPPSVSSRHLIASDVPPAIGSVQQPEVAERQGMAGSQAQDLAEAQAHPPLAVHEQDDPPAHLTGRVLGARRVTVSKVEVRSGPLSTRIAYSRLGRALSASLTFAQASKAT